MITSKQMRELESKSNIPVSVLMDNAGKQICNSIKDGQDIKNKKILIVSYHGNNGGDGFAAARYLCDEAEVHILFIGDEEKLGKSARINFNKVGDNERIQFVGVNVDFNDYDIIIDAILGIGIQGDLKADITEVINCINSSKAYKVSVDVPSGINPDNGEAADKFVNPDLVVSFHDIKNGLEKFKDKVVVVDIGLSEVEERRSRI